MTTPAKRAGNRAHESRTQLKVVTMRLGAESRARLDRLAEVYGGKRAAIEAALEFFERESQPDEQ